MRKPEFGLETWPERASATISHPKCALVYLPRPFGRPSVAVDAPARPAAPDVDAVGSDALARSSRLARASAVSTARCRSALRPRSSLLLLLPLLLGLDGGGSSHGLPVYSRTAALGFAGSG